MPDLNHLLQEIDRLDQEATKGPWVYADDGLGEVLYHYRNEIGGYGGSATVVELATEADGELIALARTVLPKLAEAVYHVLELLDVTEKTNAYGFGGNNHSPSLVTTNEVRKTITDVMNGTDDD